MKGKEDGSQKLQMDPPLAPSAPLLHLRASKRTLLNRRQHREEHAGICWTYF